MEAFWRAVEKLVATLSMVETVVLAVLVVLAVFAALFNPAAWVNPAVAAAVNPAMAICWRDSLEVVSLMVILPMSLVCLKLSPSAFMEALVALTAAIEATVEAPAVPAAYPTVAQVPIAAGAR